MTKNYFRRIAMAMILLAIEFLGRTNSFVWTSSSIGNRQHCGSLLWSANLEYSDFDLPTSNDFMTPEEIVQTCMTYLQETTDTAGLEICYNFSSDSCRMANGGSLESFLQYANNPVFQTMVRCHKWEVLNVGPEIPGTNTRGAMKTVLVHVVPQKSDIDGQERNERQFLWTLMKERRPPRQGHFLVHECIAVDNAFAHTE